MNEYTVYCHITKDGRKYIGRSKNLKSRCGFNGNNYKHNKRFYKAIQQDGWDNINHIIIETNLTKEEANELEIKLIKQYHTQDPKLGYNIYPGGELGSKGVEMSYEARIKMSNTRKGLPSKKKGIPLSKETKHKMSIAHIGKKSKPESIEKWRKSREGFKHSETTKQILSEKARLRPRRKHTEETKRKISESNKGKTIPLETRLKEQATMILKNGKAVIQTDLNNNFIARYPCIREANRVTGCGRKEINKVCQGIYKQSKGFRWYYD